MQWTAIAARNIRDPLRVLEQGPDRQRAPIWCSGGVSSINGASESRYSHDGSAGRSWQGPEGDRYRSSPGAMGLHEGGFTRTPGCGGASLELAPVASPPQIRPYEPADWPAVWALLEPVFRAGETFPHDPAITEAEARLAWMEQTQAVMVAVDGASALVGTCHLKPNSLALGAHVARTLIPPQKLRNSWWG